MDAVLVSNLGGSNDCVPQHIDHESKLHQQHSRVGLGQDMLLIQSLLLGVLLQPLHMQCALSAQRRLGPGWAPYRLLAGAPI